MKNNRAFSLIELLVVVVILGIVTAIGIVSYNKVINKSKGENYETNVSSLKVVSESYLQANKELAPKNIGDTIIIKVSDLKEANYLTEDIYNADGESCMAESYVKVYKSSQTDYVYTPYIYCGKNSAPEDDDSSKPSIEISFSPANEVANPYFTYVIKGDPSNANVMIDGFTYTIFAKMDSDSDFQEVYKSGSIAGNRQATIEGKKFLRDHIDITSYSSISISITAVNELGGIYTKVMSPDEVQTYHDDVPPECLRKLNEAKDFDDWIGKNNDPPSRTITVICGDGEKTGSGCIRTNFSKTWVNDERDASGKLIYKFGADFADLIISDNAKNTTPCDVRVNIDLASPSIDLKVKGNGVVHKEITLGGYDENTMTENAFVATIGANDYSAVNPTKNDGKVWFNYTYKDGITIEVDAKDNFYLDKWEWRVNKEGYSTNTDVATITSDVQVSNTDGDSGSFNPVERKKDNINSKKITVGFKEDGLRYGELWIWDKAKNYTKVMIYANLDKVAPDVPKDVSTHTLKSNIVTASNDKTYTKATWTNKFVRAEIESKYKKDSISGYEKVKYRVFEHKSYTKEKTTGEGKDGNYVFNDDYQGKNKIDFSVCDYAENCSDYSKKADVWIDTIDPTCTNKTTYKGNLSEAKWLGIGETATVTGVCSDKDSDIEKGSGCRSDEHLEYKYDFEINTTVAGPDGNNKGGIYHDNAGNFTTCPVDQTVKIDYTYPSCSVTKTTSSPETSYGWLGTGKTATVSAHCTDEDSPNNINSGCATADFSNVYKKEIDTINAGAKGDGAGGSVKDNADNEYDCPANQRVQIDYTAPTCTLETKLNGDKSSYGWLGIGESATVVPKCTDNKGRQTSTVMSDCDDDANDFSYLYDSNINTTKAGAKGDGNGGVTYDKAGNPGNCTPNQTVKIDHDPPTCTVSKIINGEEASENWLEKGESADVKAVCSDTGGSTCATSPFKHNYKTDINTTTAGAKGDGVGGSVLDKADNETACEANQLVKIDTIAPTCNVTKSAPGENSAGWLSDGETATISASCEETKEGAKSGCVTETFSNEYSTEINTSKAGAVGEGEPGSVSDLAGNKKVCGYKTVKIDTNAPTCSVSKSAPGENSDGWLSKGESATVTAKCSDTGGKVQSGCSGDKSFKNVYKTDINTTTAGAKGDNNGGKFSDVAGNEVTCAADQTVKIDTIAPTCSVSKSAPGENSDGWLSKGESATVTASCVETAEGAKSGCATEDFSKEYSKEIKTSKAGANGVESPGSVSDIAGNKKTCGYKTVKIDTHPPTCEVTSKTPGKNSEGWQGVGENATVTAKCSDDDGTIKSGCKGDKKFSHEYTNSIDTTKAGAKGNEKGGKFSDVAGNEVECAANQTIKIDHSAPTCSISKSNVNQPEGVNLTVTCSESGGSGLVTCAGDSSSPSTKTGIKKDKEYSVKDKADNKNNCSVSVNSKKQKRTATCDYHYKCKKDGYTDWSYSHSKDVGTGCSASVYYPDNYTKRTCDGNGMNVTYKYYTRSDKYVRSDSCDCEHWNSWGSWSDDSSCSASTGKTSKSECRTVYY